VPEVVYNAYLKAIQMDKSLVTKLMGFGTKGNTFLDFNNTVKDKLLLRDSGGVVCSTNKPVSWKKWVREDYDDRPYYVIMAKRGAKHKDIKRMGFVKAEEDQTVYQHAINSATRVALRTMYFRGWTTEQLRNYQKSCTKEDRSGAAMRREAKKNIREWALPISIANRKNKNTIYSTQKL
jgi:hypothetical protein